MKFTFFKRKPDPRIAELEARAFQWEDNAHRYRRERDDWNQKYIVLREDADGLFERAVDLIGQRDKLLHQLECHEAALLSWKYEELTDGSGFWFELKQDDGYSIDPDSVRGKILAYAPCVPGPKEFTDLMEAKAYLETLYLKSLQ